MGLLSYNENKVFRNEAHLLAAQGFGVEAHEMNFDMKLRRFTDLVSRNRISRTNAIHISLNFPPEENLPDTTMESIAGRYMELIGFGDQPFLVYRHKDSAHPHMHIVTTNIRENGTRIETHEIGKLVSEPARIRIEQEFGLITAAGRKAKNQYLPPGRFEYGHLPTKNDISNRVRNIFERYRFTSISEYQTALRAVGVSVSLISNIAADANKTGIVYQGLSLNDEKVGMPIKASKIYDKPIYSKVIQRFKANREERKKFRARTCRAIDQVINEKPSLQELIQQLKSHQVDAVISRNQFDEPFGITFIDHLTKCVFKGSDLGPGYSLSNITTRLGDCAQENEGFSSTIERLTDITDRPGRIISFWKSMGMGIALFPSSDGLKIHIGLAGSPLSSFCNSPPKISAFIRKQVMRSSLVRESPLRNTAYLAANIVSMLMDPEEDYAGLPSALLQEAKKKKRKSSSR